MDTITYIALGIPPGIAIILYIYLVLRNNKRFGNLLIKSYIAGAIGSVVLLLSLFLANKAGFASFSNLYDTLLYAFVFAGFGAELGKFLVYRFYILSKPEVDTPVHGITFSVMTALGFTTVSVLLFVLNLYESKPPYPMNMFLILAAPSNIIFGIVMGFFVGMSKFVESRFTYAFAGLIAASFFNGLFKFCLITHDYKLLNLFAFGSALIIIILIIRAINYRP
jgi:RsiW-degrading membrane proteinase PrsW (M82 family)